MILVLDLDETLAHADPHSTDPGDFKILDIPVKKRPHVEKFVQYLTDNPHYQAGVWTAAVGDYARVMVDNLFPDPSILKFVMARDFCNEAYKKPLSKIRSEYNRMYNTNYDRSHFTIIDDRENVTDFDELNHIKVKPFRGDPDDRELLDLIDFLEANKGLASECLVILWQPTD